MDSITRAALDMAPRVSGEKSRLTHRGLYVHVSLRGLGLS